MDCQGEGSDFHRVAPQIAMSPKKTEDAIDESKLCLRVKVRL